MTKLVNVERDGGVLIVAMNRPELKNALNQALVLELGAVLAQLEDDRETKAVVLTGEGGAFCSGADLKSAMSERAETGPAARLDEFHGLIHGIIRAPQPVIAAMEGPAVGFGADLGLACDLKIMGEGAYVQEKFVKIGLMSDGGGSFWLPRLIGMARTMELLLFGEKVDAKKCLELGIANRVTPRGEARALALEWAKELAAGAPLALTAIKRSVRDSYKGGIEDALAREKEGQLKLLASNDMTEGVMAWMQKRPPEFKGE